MSQMMRKQIYIQKRQQVLLRRLARARGVSEAELIRQAIDNHVSAGARCNASQMRRRSWRFSTNSNVG